MCGRLGNYIMELEDLSAELPNGKPMLKEFSYEFMKKDRIGVVGPNGVGKTTFLNVLAGRFGYSAGEVKMGETVVIGYYEQNGLKLPDDMTVRIAVLFPALQRGGRIILRAVTGMAQGCWMMLW